MKFILFIIALFALSCSKLQKYNADISQTSVSGVSAGGYMALQFQIAFSEKIVGSGIIAGGPYYCAEGQLYKALYDCMKKPHSISLSKLRRKMQQFEKKRHIDSLRNLVDQKIYLYSGTKDTVVVHGVMQQLKEQLEELGVYQLQENFNTPSEHAWVTDNYGNRCAYKGDPYINNCGENVSLQMMQHIFGSSIQYDKNVQAKPENLIKFDQTHYNQAFDSLNSEGYMYVPTACQNGEKCKVHITFHGCLQTLEDIGTKFVEHTGLNEIAEQNNIIILYPQAKKSTQPYNPKGCFDWWGYTQPLVGFNNYKYVTKQGTQMVSVWNMLNDLTGSGNNLQFAYKISNKQQEYAQV